MWSYHLHFHEFDSERNLGPPSLWKEALSSFDFGPSLPKLSKQQTGFGSRRCLSGSWEKPPWPWVPVFLAFLSSSCEFCSSGSAWGCWRLQKNVIEPLVMFISHLIFWVFLFLYVFYNIESYITHKCVLGVHAQAYQWSKITKIELWA